ncbi:hypothetical protein HID58_019631 [Brassica napus]|uniref:Uncharacterized protein n=1 Tax=Brassica napus TaxID=3708 RepID=A0ABQ8DDB4_BRANA|nr:hypothetical protein HID58_019631 [Brassica napus]
MGLQKYLARLEKTGPYRRNPSYIRRSVEEEADEETEEEAQEDETAIQVACVSPCLSINL